MLDAVARYYTTKLVEHGATPRGVDWNSPESQELRFAQLVRLLDPPADASVVDYGCGYGALAAWLRGRGFKGTYVGYDVAPAMIEAARRDQAALPACRFTSNRAELPRADVTLASGIFNVRLAAPAEEWQQHVNQALGDMASLSRQGFAFNVLTAHADADKMRPDLHYVDPAAMLSHCIRSFSRHVALAHDYALYEFTVAVRLA